MGDDRAERVVDRWDRYGESQAEADETGGETGGEAGRRLIRSPGDRRAMQAPA